MTVSQQTDSDKKPHPKLVSSGCGRERVVVDDRRDGLELVAVPLFDDPVLGHPDLGREGERLGRLLDNLELATKPGLSVAQEGKISPQKIGRLQQALVLTGLELKHYL